MTESTYQTRQEKANTTNVTKSSEGKSYPSRTIVHAKLEMTEPGDLDEQEADSVANTIASGGKISRKISNGGSSSGITVSQQMENQLSRLQGGGHTMPSGLRHMMESGFGQDFSHVRLHTDSEAADMSNRISARAFTHGNDIYFNREQFSPNTSEGQRLMAHELTHVVQGSGKIGRDTLQKEEDIKRKHYDINYYINELEWIRNYVLNRNAFNKLTSNYTMASERTPITVLIYTNELSARHEEAQRNSSIQYAFEDATSNESINKLLTNLNKKVLMIQGQPNYYGHKLIDMFFSYGPIENVIIVGHGNTDLVEIDKNYSITTKDNKFFNNIRYAFNLSDEENPNLHHSFLLPECLTGANHNSNDGITNNTYKKLNKKRDNKTKVFVRGNRGSVYTGHTEYYIENEYLKFRIGNDPTSTVDGKDTEKIIERADMNSTSNNENNPYAQEGQNSDGIVYSYTKMNREDNHTYCRVSSSYHSDHPTTSNDLILIYLSDLETPIEIKPNVFTEFIDSKHCFSTSDDPDIINKIKSFSNHINEMSPFDISITPNDHYALLQMCWDSLFQFDFSNL